MRLTLTDIAARLGREIPKFYRDFVDSIGLDTTASTLVSPAQICAVNLEERTEEPSGPNTFGFLLFSQDGYSWLAQDGDDSDAVYVWSHETRDISLAEMGRQDLLRTLAATSIPQLTREVIISRVLPHSQSILQPISLEELSVAAAGIPAMEFFEHLEGVNPFTQEIFHMKCPGVALQVTDGTQYRFTLSHGGLLCSDGPRPLPAEINVLADRLKAHVITGEG